MTRWQKTLAALFLALAVSPLVAADPGERILIRAAKPYANLVSKVQSIGGRVTYQYAYIDAVAAEVPRSSLTALRAYVGQDAIVKDVEIPLPAPLDLHALKGGPTAIDTARAVGTDTVSLLGAADIAGIAQAHPNAYLVNDVIANLIGLFAGGYTGQGVVVAQIDSGIRPGFPHISLDGSVIGCEDFVGDGLGCSNSANDGHGTFVAGMISANVVFGFAPGSPFQSAVLAECPGCFLNPPINTLIPMIGTAPSSSLYELRVFGPTGGASNSRVIQAMERAIQLRDLYNSGDPAGSKIDVCNMSLGGPTTFAGHDLIDQEADVMLAHGIVPVIAAGNAGPATLTTGSPGSSVSAITVGAASLAHNERIWERMMFGPVIGNLYRPFLGTQTSFFSSRGPNADGRPDPDVVANGFGSFSQGYGATTDISLGSGTSYATPSVSGVVAVLRQRFPNVSATVLRNAVIATANPGIFADNSTLLDRGAGYVDAGAAAAAIIAGTVSSAAPTLGSYNSSVKVNIEKGTDLDVRDGLVNETFTGLKPGERHDVLYRVQPNTKQVVVVLSGVTPTLPLEEQNQLFGDDIILAVHSAKTSSIGEGDYKVFAFSLGGTSVIDDPEQGIMRISVNGDWTNAGTIGASVTIFSVTDPVPGTTKQAKITDGQLVVIPLAIPAGTTTADFRLSWREDWGQYPTSDIDLILVRPNGTLVFDGATLNSPEHVALNNPQAGNWLVIIDGFSVPADDKYDLRIALNGKVVH